MDGVFDLFYVPGEIESFESVREDTAQPDFLFFAFPSEYAHLSHHPSLGTRAPRFILHLETVNQL